MTSKTESQILLEIDAELNTLIAKFKDGDTAIGALLVTLDTLATANNTELGSVSTMASKLATALTDATAIEGNHPTGH